MQIVVHPQSKISFSGTANLTPQPGAILTSANDGSSVAIIAVKPTSSVNNKSMASDLVTQNLLLAANLISKFKGISSQNNMNNIETGGQLFGELQHNTYVVDKLVIPKQVGWDDYWNTSDETEILVPTGSPFSSTKTAALLSNLTFDPSSL